MGDVVMLNIYKIRPYINVGQVDPFESEKIRKNMRSCEVVMEGVCFQTE
jgi:hypothetical protein